MGCACQEFYERFDDDDDDGRLTAQQEQTTEKAASRASVPATNV